MDRVNSKPPSPRAMTDNNTTEGNTSQQDKDRIRTPEEQEAYDRYVHRLTDCGPFFVWRDGKWYHSDQLPKVRKKLPEYRPKFRDEQ